MIIDEKDRNILLAQLNNTKNILQESTSSISRVVKKYKDALSGNIDQMVLANRDLRAGRLATDRLKRSQGQYSDTISARMALSKLEVEQAKNQLRVNESLLETTKQALDISKQESAARKNAIDGIKSQVSIKQSQLTAASDAADLRAQAIERLKGTMVPGTPGYTVQQRYLAQEESRLAQELAIENRYRSELDRLTESLNIQEQKVRELSAEEARLAEAMPDLLDEIKVNEMEVLNKQITASVEPFKLAAQKMVKFGSAIDKLITPVLKLSQQLGLTLGQAASVKFSNLAESIDSYISAILPGGKSGVPVTQAEIEALQSAYQKEFGGVVTSTAAREFAQQAKELGVSAEQMIQARRVFMTSTMGNLTQAKQLQDRAIVVFTQKGLTGKEALESIAKYSDIFARNGTRFAEAFARAAADAKKIGVDLSKIDQVGDNIIDNFEGFLESQAELGAMGFGFDTSKLAELAATGNTDALMKELRSELGKTGKDITKLSRPERLALESAFGMNIGELQRLAGPTVGGGEKTLTPEELQKDSNKFLGQAVGFLSAISGTMVVVGGMLTMLVSHVAAIRMTVTSGLGAAGGVAGKLGMGAAGVLGGVTAGAGIGGAMGASTTRSLVGSGIGTAIGALIGSFIAPGIGTMIGAQLGGMTGGAIAGMTAGDDVVSKPGYGARKLITPTGVLALNNKDNIIAYADDFDGTKKLPKGSISKQVTDSVTKLTGNTAGNFLTALNSEYLGRSNVREPLGVNSSALTNVNRFPIIQVDTTNVDAVTPTSPKVTMSGDNLITRNAGIEYLSKGPVTQTNEKPQPPVVNMDLSGLEQRFDSMLRAIGSMQIHMDGNKVGKVLVNNGDAISTVGVFKQEARATF